MIEAGEDRRDRLLARAKARRAGSRSNAAGPGEAKSAEEQRDDEAARELLRPLLGLFQEDGPLASFLFGERLLELIPAEAPEETEVASLLHMWTRAATRLTDLRYRRVWRDYITRMHEELGEGVPDDHPDKHALEEARFWIGDRLATGAAALENVLLQVLFDVSCEQGYLEGWLPQWLEEAYGYDVDEVESELQLRREERALQRVTYGPLDVELPRELTPKIDSALEQLLSEVLDPDALAEAAMAAANEDLTPTRRSQVALTFREAARRAEQEGRRFTAFDLRLIFELLAAEGPPAERLAWLLYSRAIDAHLAHEQRRIW